MTRFNTASIGQKLKAPIWILILILMTAAATHLLRSALKANENIAIMVAVICFTIFVIFRLGNLKFGTVRTRRYLPLSAIPFLLLAIWATNARLFGKFDVSAVLFHLDHNIAYDGVRDDIIEFIAYLVFALICIACISYLARRDRRMVWLERICAVGLLLVNPITAYAYDRLLNPQRNAVSLVAAYQPTEITAPQAPPKNLLIIYLESMEATYAKPVFGEAFADLNALSSEGLRINGVAQVQDTAWTMAGLVASQCGIPLLSYGLIMKNRMKNIETFLPNADCLGSQLAARGYQTSFYGGARLNFAGKGKFLTSHGYQRTVGLDEIPEEQRGEVGEWGIYDDRLFELALKELETLSGNEAPYLLSVLTLGAHFPVGYPAPVCYDMFDGAEEMDGSLLSVACTARLTREFLREAKTRGYLGDTVVVLLSDHLSHKNSQTRRLNQFKRENFVLILRPDGETGEITKRGSMMDVYPTILESLGLSPKNGPAGLGVSLLGTAPTRLEQYGQKALDLAIRSDKALREHLWDLKAQTQESREIPR